MWKKIILGIVISVVVLTISAGAIYAFQKNTPEDENDIVKPKGYAFAAAGCSGLKFSSETIKTQQKNICPNCDNENCANSICTGENCQCLNNNNGNCPGVNCNEECNQERNCNMEKNGYCTQEANMEGFCHQYKNTNQCKSSDNETNYAGCGQLSSVGQGTSGTCFGKNK